MPAVDPQRLKRQAEQVAQASGDPDELLRRALALLEKYADRVRRPPGATRPEDALPGFGAPQPVVRTLAAAIDGELDADLAARLAVVEALWRAEQRETQQIAAELLGRLGGEQVPDRIESMVRGGASPIAAGWLIRRGTRAWRAADPSSFLARARAWLEADDEAMVQAGLLALSAYLDEAAGEQLPRLFASLSGLAHRLRGAPQRAYRELLSELAARSAPECAQFLLDELRQANHARPYRELVRSLLPNFSDPQRAKLERALRAAS